MKRATLIGFALLLLAASFAEAQRGGGRGVGRGNWGGGWIRRTPADAPRPPQDPDSPTTMRTVEGGGVLELPPVLFHDGGRYQVSDFDGKLLVICLMHSWYVEDTFKGFSKLPALYRNAPVKFLGVMYGRTPDEVKIALRLSDPGMPIMPDTFDLVRQRLRAAGTGYVGREMVVIGPDGTVVGTGATSAVVEKALENVGWKYRDGGYDKGLAEAIELLEWNQYERGVPMVRRLMFSANKSLAESARKLYDVLLAEGRQLKEHADEIAQKQPADAHDIYQKLATSFAGDELARAVQEPLNRLKASKQVKDEQAARKMAEQIYGVMAQAERTKRFEIAKYCRSIAEKYPGTPTAQKVMRLANELENVRAWEE